MDAHYKSSLRGRARPPETTATDAQGQHPPADPV
jgi:hypothetical protein